MTERSTKNMAASVHQRLLNLRETSSSDYNELLTHYAIERFLYRLSKSSFAKTFILKGAMLFRVWSGTRCRPTKDLDLLGFGEPTQDAVVDAVRDIVSTSVADDGLIFDSSSVRGHAIREGQEYDGIRVKLIAMLGNARIPMQVDVGFGDVITPEARAQCFPTLLDMDAPHLYMYPPETVVAEKTEAMIRLGMTNSRMKDYFDVLLLLRDGSLTDESLADAMAATFQRRQTLITPEVPPGLSDDFGCDERVKRLWREFVGRGRHDDEVPSDFGIVVSELRSRIWPILLRVRDCMKP